MEFDVGTVVGLLVLMFGTVVGVLSNIFIVLVLGLEIMKEHRVLPSNKLLIALCFSATCFGIMLAANTITGLVLPEKSITGHVVYTFYVLNMYSISSCSWLTSSLCFFYFIKIAQFRSSCLAWVKSKIDNIVLWMLVVVEGLASGGTILNFLLIDFSDGIATSNSTTYKFSVKTSKYLNVIYMINAVPFVVVMVSTAWTVVSLKLHICKMNKTTSNPGNVKVHRRVVWTMVELLVMYGAFYLVMFLYLFPTIPQLGLEKWLYLILMSFFSPIQSAILIHSNPKIMKIWKALLRSGSG